MTSCATSPDAPLLVLCGAESLLQIVLGQGDTVLHAEAIHCPGASITTLAPSLARILQTHGLTARDLAGAAAVRGPGSFTGLRITLATLAGLGLAADIPLAGLELHGLLASQVPYPGRLWVATHARRGLVYAQSFENGHAQTPIQVLAAEELITQLSDTPTLTLGSGLRSLSLPCPATLLPPFFDIPWPGSLLAAARTATFQTSPPAPLYLRRSDAEENLAAIASARGISEAEARRAIPEFVASS